MTVAELMPVGSTKTSPQALPRNAPTTAHAAAQGGQIRPTIAG